MLEQISFKNLRLLCNHKPKVLKQKAALQACKNHTSLDNWVLKTRHCLGFVDASSIRQAPTKNVMFVISNLFNLKPKQFVGRKQKEKQFHESTWVEYVFSFVWNKLNRRRDESKTPSYANTFFGGITFLVPGHSLNFSQFFIKIYNSWIKGWGWAFCTSRCSVYCHYVKLLPESLFQSHTPARSQPYCVFNRI